MQVCIDQNVLSKFPNISDDVVVTVKLAGENTSDFLCPLNFPLKNLDSISWSKINEIGRAGKARVFFALGATKKDFMKNGFVAEWQIIGFDHDDLADDSGKAPITWDLVSLYNEEIYMKHNGKRSCWDSSNGRKYLNIDFFENMSDELQGIIKPVWKYTVGNKNTGMIIPIKDSIWLKSEKELYGRCFYSYDGEGHWYEFYAQEGIKTFKLNCNGKKDWQWLRSISDDNSYNFCNVTISGCPNTCYSGSTNKFAPCFCT